MDADRLLKSMSSDPELADSLRVIQRREPRRARTEELPASLPAALRTALAKRGIEGLYCHQRRVLDELRAGRHAVVATPTASGKSLCYHLPVLEGLLQEERSRAIYLFPTKALSRDQLASVTELVDDMAELSPARRIVAHVYDGDTPPHIRRALREEGDLIVTNPYMLHVGILPHHAKWSRLFQGLRYVVVDELHMLSGVFGSHVANVLRRLQRIARHYGSAPRFVLSSATIGNPKELAEKLVGEPVTLVDEDGSPRGARTFACVQPPIVHRQLGLRRTAVDQTLKLARPILASGLHSIFFGRSRNGVEVLLKYLQDLAEKLHLDPARIRGYRGGYLPDERRAIEQGLRAGDIQCVVATNALELGIDIGSLDVAVMVGYPGSVSSTFQRAGRAGRRAAPSLALLVARSVATDQYLVRHPDYLVNSPAERIVIDPDNLVVRVNQLKCAAFELPFEVGEEFGGDGDTDELLEYLAAEAKILARVGDRYYYSARSFPAENVSLHTGDMDNFVILDAEKKTPIAEIDRPSATSMVHPEAIYNLQGVQYYIEEMDYEGRRVYARKVDVDYYTEAEVEAEIRALHLDRERPMGQGVAHFGDVTVRKLVPMYKKIRFYTRENIGAGDIHLPQEDLDTEGLALVIPDGLATSALLFQDGKGAALQGLADLCKKVVPLWVRCDAGDVGATAELRSNHFGLPTVYLWDEVPGGVGLAEHTYEILPTVLEAMWEVVTACPCPEGCPGCVGPSLASGRREKGAVIELLEGLLQGHSFAAQGSSG